MQTPYLRRLGLGVFPRPTMVLTSKVYPLVAPVESMRATLTEPVGGTVPDESAVYQEGLNSSLISVLGSLHSTFREYTEWIPEEFISSLTGVDGELRQVLKTYEDWEVESLTSSVTEVMGSLNQILISYDNYETEELQAAFVSVTGDLT